ncbi:MAG: hypothetical protein HY323_09075 [Betaproteobacteria bacterium]|nr:hypothetical protein [Betaproteobacteria bacterium]
MTGGMPARLAAERARRDAHWFIFESKLLLTKDEHDPARPVKPFPDVPYLRALLDCLLLAGRLVAVAEARWALEAGMAPAWLDAVARSGICFVEKSRDVMATWTVLAYCHWRARAYPHQLILIQSKREDEAASFVFMKDPEVGRMSFMEAHLPPALRQLRFPVAGAYGHLYYPNGSHVWAIPEGGHVIRSNHPSVVFADEAAFQPEFGASYTAALPAVQGGGSYIAVSSANPGEFCDLVEGAAA